MSGYLVNFAVYTMAMIGLIFFALMVYKKLNFSGEAKSSNRKILSIEETISIAPRKTLYVVRAGSEKFLIAGDVDKTTLISKLDNSENIQNAKEEHKKQFKQECSEILDTIFQEQTNTIKNESPAIEEEECHSNDMHNKSVDDLPIIVDFENKTKKTSVISKMLKRINE